MVVGLNQSEGRSSLTAAPPSQHERRARALVFASADSAVLAFAPALLARPRRLVRALPWRNFESIVTSDLWRQCYRLVRLGCRLVVVVEFDRAIGHQHLAVDVFEVRFGERRCRFARTAFVGVLRQPLAALEVEVIGAIDRHPGADFIGEGGDEDWA